MATPNHPPVRGSDEGRDVRSIGPSDSSDSGSDLIGPGIMGDETSLGLDALPDEDVERGKGPGGNGGDSFSEPSDDTSDRSGTGEGLAADGDTAAQAAADIAPDRVIGAEEAGLGGGLDQAEEAQLGVTDEELAGRRRN